MTEGFLAAAIGVFAACGVWLMLRARTFDVALGLALFSYAVNLFIFAMGRLTFGAPAIVGQGAATGTLADPLPQALVLTAIVIAFAMTALVLTLALKNRFVNHGDACDADDETRVEEVPR